MLFFSFPLCLSEMSSYFICCLHVRGEVWESGMPFDGVLVCWVLWGTLWCSDPVSYPLELIVWLDTREIQRRRLLGSKVSKEGLRWVLISCLQKPKWKESTDILECTEVLYMWAKGIYVVQLETWRRLAGVKDSLDNRRKGWFLI